MSGESLQSFKDFCKDKKILLVGNSLTALQREQASLIDSYDIVLRFGKGVLPGYENYIGSKTDVWMTGQFRLGMRKYLPDNVICLYQPPYRIDNPEIPEWEHIQMFTPEELLELTKEFATGDERLSAGAQVSLFLKRKIKTYKELNYINFDFFQQKTGFIDKFHGITSEATSWHLPLTPPKFIDGLKQGDGCHKTETEKKVFQSVFDDRVNFIGLSYKRPTYIKNPNAAWDHVRLRPNE